MTEEWRAVTGASRYEVSSIGRVRCLRSNHWVRQHDVPFFKSASLDSAGYPQTGLVLDDGRKVTRKIHLLVATAFHGDRPTGAQCNHKDGVKANSIATNLEWLSVADNCRHAWATGLHKSMRATAHPHAKLTYEQADTIRQRYAARERTQTGLANEYGVSQRVIWRIVQGLSYH